MYEMKYPNLFKPIVIGGTLFRNRIFASPTGYQNVTGDDILPPGAEAYYERKAAEAAALEDQNDQPDDGEDQQTRND